jgi:hypothetical protein
MDLHIRLRPGRSFDRRGLRDSFLSGGRENLGEFRQLGALGDHLLAEVDGQLAGVMEDESTSLLHFRTLETGRALRLDRKLGTELGLRGHETAAVLVDRHLAGLLVRGLKTAQNPEATDHEGVILGELGRDLSLGEEGVVAANLGGLRGLRSLDLHDLRRRGRGRDLRRGLLDHRDLDHLHLRRLDHGGGGHGLGILIGGGGEFDRGTLGAIDRLDGGKLGGEVRREIDRLDDDLRLNLGTLGALRGRDLGHGRGRESRRVLVLAGGVGGTGSAGVDVVRLGGVGLGVHLNSPFSLVLNYRIGCWIFRRRLGFLSSPSRRLVFPDTLEVGKLSEVHPGIQI